MIYCYLNLRDVSAENNLKLICVGVGNFDVFTGLGELKNNANYYMEKNGPIPPGIYWIVDRPTGGFGSWLKKKEKEFRTGNVYDDWFALFKDDGSINDQTIVVFKSFLGCGDQEKINDIHAFITYSSPLSNYDYLNRTDATYMRNARWGSQKWRETSTCDLSHAYDIRSRSAFRLHPLRPDGTGVSDGCITFCRREEFYRLRRALSYTHKMLIPGTSIEAYGKITVGL